MSRQKTRTAVYMGGKYDPELAVKFGQLCKDNGISNKEALRRLMVQAIISRQIPGIDALDLEAREHEKYGAATPVYDGEATERPKSNVKQAPASPSQ